MAPTIVAVVADIRPDSIHRLPYVSNVTGLSPTTIWRQERRGEFPKRVQLSPNAVGWREADIAQWLADRARGIGASRVPSASSLPEPAARITLQKTPAQDGRRRPTRRKR
jgi:prophage regulatory protein